MKGLVKEKPVDGAVFRTDLPVPEITSGQALVKVKATAICGTDLHLFRWSDYAAQRMQLPMVFGHEFSGEIVKVGAGVKDFKVGDRVAGETHIPCNDCVQCRNNRRHICENMKIIGVNGPGCFAEYIAVPEDCLFRIGDDVDDITGAMLEPMGVAVHGLMAGNIAGKNVAILGCGPIGLMAVASAKAMGAKTVISTDIRDDKLALAKELGADVIINTKASADALINYCRDTFGSGADVTIDFTGSPDAVRSGMLATAKGGRFVMVGLPASPYELNFSDCIIYRELEVIGVTGRLMYETWDECQRLLSSGVDIKPVVGKVWKLEEYEQAFDALYGGAVGKMIMIP